MRRVKSHVLVQANESDLAQALSGHKFKGIGQAVELDLAQTITAFLATDQILAVVELRDQQLVLLRVGDHAVTFVATRDEALVEV